MAEAIKLKKSKKEPCTLQSLIEGTEIYRQKRENKKKYKDEVLQDISSSFNKDLVSE